MQKIIFPILLFIGVFTASAFIISDPPCSTFKNGRFHLFTKSNQNHYIYIREDSLQKEINLKTGDTSYWKVKWLSDCEFECRYISGVKFKSQEDENYYKNSFSHITIIKTSKLYYTYNLLFTAKDRTEKYSDTMWLHKR